MTSSLRQVTRPWMQSAETATDQKVGVRVPSGAHHQEAVGLWKRGTTASLLPSGVDGGCHAGATMVS